jgi:kynurenine formamidase
MGMETVDIGAMNGPALLIEAYDVPVLNREALEALGIPHEGVSRLIIRTDNTRRKLMHTTAFTPDYVAFDEEGAKWLVEHRPDIRSIGIDYLSIAALDHLAEAHVALLDHGIVPIEGLVLDEDKIKVGWWWLHCAPLKVEGSDGAPARAWLTPVNDPAGAKGIRKGSPCK